MSQNIHVKDQGQLHLISQLINCISFGSFNSLSYIFFVFATSVLQAASRYHSAMQRDWWCNKESHSSIHKWYYSEQKWITAGTSTFLTFIFAPTSSVMQTRKWLCGGSPWCSLKGAYVIDRDGIGTDQYQQNANIMMFSNIECYIKYYFMLELLT